MNSRNPMMGDDDDLGATGDDDVDDGYDNDGEMV